MIVDPLVAWLLLILKASLLHMPSGGGRSYIPILTGAANCVDAEVMYSGREALLLLTKGGEIKERGTVSTNRITATCKQVERERERLLNSEWNVHTAQHKNMFSKCDGSSTKALEKAPSAGEQFGKAADADADNVRNK